ncbi:MAG: ubiquinone/menaquinone biosynthesis methyltransferase [Candidatus Delongbacteria bacterium]|nr:ubiquinone/menaquinone biosynthesis methyltransferase [Candidatus Delongbacteria bacterium]
MILDDHDSGAGQLQLDNRSRKIQKMFSRVPQTYEKVNHSITLGLDIRWRKRLVRQATAIAQPGNWVDMCTGTGEVAVYLQQQAPPGTQVWGVDFTPGMLEVARKKPEASSIRFITSDIKALPFKENCLDLVTMSFATRNINLDRETLVRSFAGYCRALKPGGSFVNLESSRPSSRFVRWCNDLYIKLLIRSTGSRISGAESPYAYLARTIPRFYPAAELADILREAGFSRVRFKQLLFGAVAIHIAVK